MTKTTTRTKPAAINGAEAPGRKIGAGDNMAAAREVAAQTRELRAAIKPYLEHITGPAAKKGGVQRDPDRMRRRLEVIEHEKPTAEPLHRVLLIQEQIDLTNELAGIEISAAGVDVDELERAFVGAAGRYSEIKGITWAAWRGVGVPAPVLRNAGIPETRQRRPSDE